MSAPFKHLIELINEMEGLCAELVPLIAAERRSLVELEFERLQEIAAQKNRLVDALASKRAETLTLAGSIAQASGHENVDRVAKLVLLLPPELSEELNPHYLRFQARAQEVEFVNATNRLLAEEGLLSMEEAISWLFGQRENQVTYDRPGQTPKVEPQISQMYREV